MVDFSRIEYLTFDCYGTLIDWESGILGAIRPLLLRKGILLGDAEILACYSRFEPEAEHGAYKSYRRILQLVTQKFAAHLGFSLDASEEALLAQSLPQWPPFSDTVESLQALRQRFKLVVLSNIDRDMIALTAKALGIEFHRIITAEDVHAYKPEPAHFKFAIEELKLTQANHCHVAQSLFHDIAPAQSLGLNHVWIDRRAGKTGSGATPQTQVTPDLSFPDLVTFTSFALR
jgi:2-haloacid dehalogenase